MTESGALPWRANQSEQMHGSWSWWWWWTMAIVPSIQLFNFLCISMITRCSKKFNFLTIFPFAILHSPNKSIFSSYTHKRKSVWNIQTFCRFPSSSFFCIQTVCLWTIFFYSLSHVCLLGHKWKFHFLLGRPWQEWTSCRAWQLLHLQANTKTNKDSNPARMLFEFDPVSTKVWAVALISLPWFLTSYTWFTLGLLIGTKLFCPRVDC